MSEKLTIEKFGEIMDDFLRENEINMLITLPEGSIEPRIQDNTGMGCVVQFYILLSALPPVFKGIFEMVESENESLIDGMLELVKNELMSLVDKTDAEKNEGEIK